jgi:hypothetical protein
MDDVVLKGEIHTSNGDLNEEKELVKNGIDTLVLEGDSPGKQSEPGWLDGWFSISTWLFDLVLGNVYVSKYILVDLAEAQDADVVYTRDSNSELIDNTNRIVKTVAALLFYILVAGSLVLGYTTGDLVSGAAVLMMGVLLPILLLRVYNTKMADGEMNRDQIIADKIVSASEESSSVVAVVGEEHVEGVNRRLPSELQVDTREPAYGKLSKPHLKELLVPGFTAFSVLFVFYVLLLGISRILLPI